MPETKDDRFARVAKGLRTWARNPKRLRQQGDAARDAQNWPAAARAYGAYLKLRENDAAIWVQYGHAVKERVLSADRAAGPADPLQIEWAAESERAYRRAMALMPADADVRLHLAHLLKQLDRVDEAKPVFSELLEISPSLENLGELRAVGGTGQLRVSQQHRPALAVEGGIYIELRDLFSYLSVHTTVTGITRVTLGLVNYILEDMESGRASRYNFVQQFRDAEGLLLISRSHMREVVRQAMSSVPDSGKMQALIETVRTTSVVFRLDRGDTYFIPGAFWEFVHNPSWIGGMRQRGVRIGAYIYDLIPITHHQYCMIELTEAFTVAFAETARLLDFALTISEFVAKEVTNYLEVNEIAPLVTVAVPLAHELRFGSSVKPRFQPKLDMIAARPGKTSGSQPELRTYLANIPFVMCVCTIEARKNHVYLFTIWQRMIQAGLNVPDLVFVGRPGWRVGDLLDEITNSRSLGGRLHILSGLTDDELSDLYGRCLFTVFPSFVEGWGLPVGESLTYGKVCVASSTSSIPEVGGQHVLYVDPFDIEDGYRTISNLVRDPGLLARMEKDLRDSFVPRSWAAVGLDFFGKLDTILADIDAGASKREVFVPVLRTGEFLDVASLSRLGRHGGAYVRNPARLIFTDGWRGIEDAGAWMLNTQASLTVHTSCKPMTKVSVLLNLGTSPWVGAYNTIKVTAGEDAALSYCRPLSPDTEFWVTVPGITDASGHLQIQIAVTGTVFTKQPTDIPVTVRFKGMAYAPADDLEGRLSLLGQVLLSPGSR